MVMVFWLLRVFQPLFCAIPRALGIGSCVDVVRWGWAAHNHSLHCDQLCFSNCLYHRKKVLWWELETILACNLTTLLSPRTYLTSDLLKTFLLGRCLCRSQKPGTRSNQEGAVYVHVVHSCYRGDTSSINMSIAILQCCSHSSLMWPDTSHLLQRDNCSPLQNEKGRVL